MNALLMAIHHPLAFRVGWVLLHSVWQGALVGVVFSLVRASLRRRPAEARYLAGCLGLALLLAAPLATLLLGATATASAETGTAATFSRPMIDQAALPSSLVPPPPALFFPTVVTLFTRLAPVAAAFWLVGVIILSGRLVRSCWWVRTLRTSENEPVDSAWLETLNDLRCRLEISRPVGLLKSALVQVPAVIGWLRPIILLPAATLSGLTPTQFEAILAHELAHVRRLDCLVNAFQCLVETLLFYHPVVWWISGCVREERENCCDDLVVKVCGDRLAYARALAALEEFRADLPELAFAAGGGSLLNRIRRLLGTQEGGGLLSARQLGGLVSCLIGLVLIVSGFYLEVAPDSFRATARIKIERDRSDLPGLNNSPSENPYDPYFIQTEFEVIQSELILGKVVDDLDLNKEWGKKYAGGEKLKTSETISILKRRIALRPVRNTSLIEIQVSSESRDEPARIANAMAEAYRSFRQEKRRQMGLGGIRALEERWNEQEQRVRQAQDELGVLRKKLNIPDVTISGAASPMLLNAETLRRIEGLRIENQAQLAQQEALLSQLTMLKATAGGEELAQALPAELRDTTLNSLLVQLDQAELNQVGAKKDYGPEHLEVVKLNSQVEVLHKKIRNRVEGIFAGLQVKIASLKEGLDNLNKEIERGTKIDIEKAEQSRPYFDKKRELEVMQRFSEILSSRIASENIELSLPDTTSAVIVDRAMPPLRPIWPNRDRATMMIAFGFLLELLGLWMLTARPRAKTVLAAA